MPLSVPQGSRRRWRSRLTRVARRLDTAAGRVGGRRTVLFDTRSPLNFGVLRPVLDGLRADARVAVRITHDDREDIARALKAAGLGPLMVPRSRTPWLRTDLYVNADPWRPAHLHRAARRLNFFHGVAGKYNLDEPSRDALLFTGYDRVAFVNTDRLGRYLARGVVRHEQAVLVGYPKLDALVSGAYDARAVRQSLGFDVDRPTVMYAPTWSPASSLHVAGEAIVEALLDQGLNVIAKLHDNCFLLDAKYAAGVDWRQRLSRFEASGRFALAEVPDASPLLAASDLLVTDHSSIGFEFLALDRPLVVFDAPDLARHARINPEKVAQLRSAATVVASPGELARAVCAALADPAARSSDRRHVAGEMFFRPGTATARALALAYELIALHPPAALMAHRTGMAVRAS